MFNWLTKLFSSRRSGPQRPEGFQPATLLDESFIFHSILAEAAHGHFSSNYHLPNLQLGLIDQIQSSIIQGVCPTHRSPISESSFYVVVKENNPVGFSWVVETDKRGERELYLLAVSPEHRAQGIGRTLVSETIARFPPKTKFIARLYQPSQVMLKMLIKMGFKRVPSTAKSTKTLSYVSG